MSALPDGKTRVVAELVEPSPFERTCRDLGDALEAFGDRIVAELAIVELVTVKCQKCGRVHCEASRGSTVKFRCRRCQMWNIQEPA